VSRHRTSEDLLLLQRVIPPGHVHGFKLFVSLDDIQSRQKIQELIRSDLDVTVLISTNSIEIADAQAAYVVERSRILVPKFASDLSAAKFSTRARRAGFVNTARVEPGDELVAMHTLRVRTEGIPVCVVGVDSELVQLFVLGTTTRTAWKKGAFTVRTPRLAILRRWRRWWQR
jgi:hypothetical protein